MMRITLICGLLAVALATDPVVRTKEEVDAFRAFLTSTKTGNAANYLARTSPPENPEENGHFEGDIVLDDFLIDDMVDSYSQGRSALINPILKWPSNTVVYEFGEGEFGPLQQAAILEGMRDIESKTCIRFRPRASGERVYVLLTGDSDGCYAHVGYNPLRGAHTYNLARNIPGLGCFRHATIVHEWMHILGFYHMQSTHDRDNFVRIQFENVISGFENNFFIYNSNSVTNLGIDYDYVSCMHYNSQAFTSNGLPTIVALRSHEGTMGQREIITESDWKRINRHHNCAGAWN